MSARANTTKVEPDHPERVTADEIAHLLLTGFGVTTTGEEWEPVTVQPGGSAPGGRDGPLRPWPADDEQLSESSQGSPRSGAD